jgi:hypothetical protein
VFMRITRVKQAGCIENTAMPIKSVFYCLKID